MIKPKRPAPKRKKNAEESIQEPFSTGNVTIFNFGQVSLIVKLHLQLLSLMKCIYSFFTFKSIIQPSIVENNLSKWFVKKIYRKLIYFSLRLLFIVDILIKCNFFLWSFVLISISIFIIIFT